MAETIINVQGLSKQYQLGAVQESFSTLRDAMADTLRAPLRRLRNHTRGRGQTLWALKDVSFRVAPGEVLGIIGRNGAGKSTLLKVLSRITEPTSGRVELYGRVASLLEVGTGFHPELSGRENIFLNGAILGMRREEIANKFDEIVEFAELEKFIDTPVKRYSSGMYVRLAFAVAAHLEPDILIVDEVLAVGDAAFQKRCLGKMQDVTKLGRTVILVTHNMSSVKSFCTRALLLENGRITCEGGVDRVVDTYLTAGSEPGTTGVIPDGAHSGTGEVLVRQVELKDLDNNPITQVYFGQTFRVVMTLDVVKRIEGVVIGVGISTTDGTRIMTSYNIDGGRPPLDLVEGTYKLTIDLNPTLLPRRCAIDVAVCQLNGADVDVVSSTLQFDALGVAETGEDHFRWGTVHGFVRLEGRWQIPERAGRSSFSEAVV
jgi:lipopolysaccharide transport system ATP-binding protein